MYTCGYICPSCEGNGFLDDGAICQWCQPLPEKVNSTNEIEIIPSEGDI